MKKTEIFALLTGFIGLTADAITLTIFFSKVGTPYEAGSTPTISLKLFIAATLIYGWLVISFMLVRRRLKKGLIKQDFPLMPKEISPSAVGECVIPIGLLILPLQWLYFSILFPITDPFFYHKVGPEINVIQWFMFILLMTMVSLGGIGTIIVLTIEFLMPVIYDDVASPR